MTDESKIQETKIKGNVEILRQVFEPLTVGLTPDVEPATIYAPQSPIPVTKNNHDS